MSGSIVAAVPHAAASDLIVHSQAGDVQGIAADEMHVIREDLLVRLSPEDGDAVLAEPDVRLMEIGSRTSRGFLSVAPEATSTDRQLQTWVDRGVAFASSLPPKKPKPKKPKI